MPLTRLEVLPAFSVHEEGENAAVLRGKNSLSVRGKLIGAEGKHRAVLGDICNTRSTSTNVVSKADVSENDLKEPFLLPIKTTPKKHAQGSESLLQPIAIKANAAPVILGPERPQSFSSQLLSVKEIDTDTDTDWVAVYVKDIYKYLRELEGKFVIKKNYMKGYKIRPCNRKNVINWIVGVHGRFMLAQETLYLTVATIDRFLQAERTISPHELRLVGLTAMFIASKYEETMSMFSLKMDDFVIESDATRKEFLRIEHRILKALGFSLGRPLPLHFLVRYMKAARSFDWYNSLHTILSLYLMELSLPEYEFCHDPPSQLAAASLCLSLKILDESDTPIDVLWNDTLIFYSGYNYEALEATINKLCSLLISQETSTAQTIREKYNVEKLHYVSALPHFKSPRTRCLLVKMAFKSYLV